MINLKANIYSFSLPLDKPHEMVKGLQSISMATIRHNSVYRGGTQTLHVVVEVSEAT